MIDGVAAYVSTFNEGPYLKELLRWLSKRVDAVYVFESCSAWAKDENADTKSLTEKIVNELPDDCVVQFIKTEGQQHDEPLIKETSERNQALRRIYNDGYKWVWWVDADEFYTDFDAEALWDWFGSKLEENPDIKGARCSWHTYWRSMHWKVDPPEPYKPNIIVRTDCVIASSRHMTDESCFVSVPPEVCMARHYSWAKSPEEIEKKVTTWGHAKEGNLLEWKRKTFDKWRPGSNMFMLHPTEPAAYGRIVECHLPVPEALQGHPYNGVQLIEGELEMYTKKRIKAVVLAHNRPEEADSLAGLLGEAFDDVEVIDCGSDPDKIPDSVTVSLENVYWTGAWNYAMEQWSDYDAIWIVGDHVKLEDPPAKYREAIEDSLPFGCWSPAVKGRSKEFMKPIGYMGRRIQVKNVEGMSLAISGELARHVRELPKGSDGYGQDFWLCHVARQEGMRNFIDGRVRVYHPDETGYDDAEFCKQMDDVFGEMFGPDYRETIFEYSEDFGGNMIQDEESSPQVKKVLVGVDNGLGFSEFERIAANVPEMDAIMVSKGVSVLSGGRVKVVGSDKFDEMLALADVVLLPRVGFCNRPEYAKALASGVPVVVKAGNEGEGIFHEKNVLLYESEDWASGWIKKACVDEELRDMLKRCNEGRETIVNEEREAIVNDGTLMVSVITPTWKRDLEVIQRCMDCVALQTGVSWEHLICSNGGEEIAVRKLVERRGDPRVKYFHTGPVGKGDYGNTARAMMIEKAEGILVAFVDDDNIVLPDFLKEMSDALNGTAKGFAVCDIVHFGPLDKRTGMKPPVVLKGEPVKLTYIDPLQVVVRMHAIKSVGWDIETGYLSDGVTLEKLGDEFEHVKVDKVLGFHM